MKRVDLIFQENYNEAVGILSKLPNREFIFEDDDYRPWVLIEAEYENDGIVGKPVRSIYLDDNDQIWIVAGDEDYSEEFPTCECIQNTVNDLFIDMESALKKE